MVSLPFLLPIYAPFFGDAYRGWLALALGVATMATFVASGKGDGRVLSASVALAVPSAAGVALIGLASLLAVQIAVGRSIYVEANLSAILYLMWALALMVAVATLRERLGLRALADHLAVHVLVGSVVCAGLAITGFGGYGVPWLAPMRSSVVSGPLGQPNHFAHYLWLGVASLLHLRGRGRLCAAATSSILLLLLLGSSLSGSRGSLLYAALIVAVCYRSGSPTDRRWAAGTAVTYGVLAWLAPKLPAFQIASAWQRVHEDAVFLLPEAIGGGSVRLTLLEVAWRTFLDAPWFGSGFGGFRWASFATADRVTGWQGAGEHAHNLFAHLLAELGVVAPVVVAIALAVWGGRLLAHSARREAAWIASMAGIGLIHAQVEYPFWYPALLGVFAAVAALADKCVMITLRRAIVVLGIIAAVAVLASYGYDLARMEALTRSPMRGNADNNEVKARVAAIAELRRGSLLAPYIDASIVALVPPTKADLENRLVLCRRSLAYVPAYPSVHTCALLNEIAGHHHEARRLWQLAVIAFPGRDREYLSMIEESLSSDDLAPIRRLLDEVSASR